LPEILESWNQEEMEQLVCQKSEAIHKWKDEIACCCLQLLK
jgi:hypothetical protein